MRARLAQQDGFTLIEAMFTCVLMVIITGSTQLVLQGAFKRNDTLQKQASSLQQVRLGMESMERLIRSQVCLTTSVYPVVAADGTSFTFFADTTNGALANTPVKHTLSLDATSKQLRDAQYVTNGTAADGTPTFPSAATRTNVLASDVAQDGTTPVFQYYGFTATVPATPTVALNSSVAPVVSSANLSAISKVLITLQGNAKGASTTPRKTSNVIQDQVFARVSDPNFAAPNKTVPGPTCRF
jgi:Tfp pilus assembly protein PilV